MSEGFVLFFGGLCLFEVGQTLLIWVDFVFFEMGFGIDEFVGISY